MSTSERTASAGAAFIPPKPIRQRWDKLRRSRAWDLAMRVPFSAWVLLVAIVSVQGLGRYVHNFHAGAPIAFALGIAMRLSTLSFLMLLGASVVLRTRPVGRAHGLEPRLSALFGTFLLYGLPLFPRHELLPAAEFVSTVLVLLGSAGAASILCRLGRSFSIMAEARRLVTAGPYRYVRHPLYLAEELAAVGVFLQFLSPWTALILSAQIAFQIRRMGNEERVLEQTFPDYARYKARTARLIPGIY